MKSPEFLKSNALRVALIGMGIVLSSCRSEDESMSFSKEVRMDRVYMIESGDRLDSIVKKHYPFTPGDFRFSIMKEMVKRQSALSSDAIRAGDDLLIPAVPEELLKDFSSKQGMTPRIILNESTGEPMKITWVF